MYSLLTFDPLKPWEFGIVLDRAERINSLVYGRPAKMIWLVAPEGGDQRVLQLIIGNILVTMRAP
jgi:hypothetical protein